MAASTEAATSAAGPPAAGSSMTPADASGNSRADAAGVMTSSVALPSPSDTAHATLSAVEAVEESLDDIRRIESESGGKAPYCPIVYGTIAFWLGKTRTGSQTEHSHRWTVYVRGADGRDISYCVKEVTFKLHETITDNVRTVKSHPFEVTETGWGEFDIGIQIAFHDSSIPPVSIVHHLKLFAGSAQNSQVGKPVVSEYYDELVFNHPDSLFQDDEAKRRLLRGPTEEAPEPHPYAHFFHEHSAEPDLALLANAHAFISQETSRLMERLCRADAEAEQLQEDLETLGWPSGDTDRSTSGDHTAGT